MKKFLLLIFLFILPVSSAYPLFTPVQGIEDTYIKRVVKSPLQNYLLYASSRNNLFKSSDSGLTFTNIFSITDDEINHIFFDDKLADIVYVVSNRRIYQTVNGQVQKLFSCPDETVVLSAAKWKGKMYAGTANGLYSADCDILNWQKLSFLSADASVYFIEASPDILYLATSMGVYALSEKQEAKRIFVSRDSVEEDRGLIPQVIKADNRDSNKIWLGTNKGLFVSPDKGASWNKLYTPGLNGLSINCIAQNLQGENILYLGTAKGIVRYNIKNDAPMQLFEGLPVLNVFWIDFTASGQMYAATDKGLFNDNYCDPLGTGKDLRDILANEPDITDIQQAAVRYNDAQPEKILKWRRELKVKALFPSVNLNYAKSIYGTAGTNSYDGKSYVGPRDWNVGFSWDIGELVWNSHQDDVDTRSRLNTQLRLDILDEINRIYFERLRLKKEIGDLHLPENESFQKGLRLKELTAMLDGYTGGFFSKRSRELSSAKVGD